MDKNPQEASSGDLGSNIMEIPRCDEDKMRFYFNTLIQDFTYAVLRHFEAELARKPGVPLIVTPLDADLPEKAVKSLQGGRLSKIKVTSF